MKRRLWLGICAGLIIQTVVVSASPGVHAASNLVGNPSVQTGNAADNAPANWLKNKWGQNTATFT